MNKIRKYLLVPAMLLVAAGCGSTVSNAPQQQQPVTQKPVMSAFVLASTKLDSSGNPVSPASSFKTSDKTIYLVVKIANAKKNDVVSYARYYNGKYINAQSTRVKQDNVNKVLFAFSNSKGYPAGSYSVKIFYNKQPTTLFNYSVR